MELLPPMPCRLLVDFVNHRGRAGLLPAPVAEAIQVSPGACTLVVVEILVPLVGPVVLAAEVVEAA
jgi:hypothetical protein